MGYARVRVGIQVTRQDSKWIPFTYRMFWCRQRGIPTDPRLCPVSEWASESIGNLSYFGGVLGENTMKVGESRRYWATIVLRSWQDYWGEWDESVEFLKVRRVK